jgi:hypothetical protein
MTPRVLVGVCVLLAGCSPAVAPTSSPSAPIAAPPTATPALSASDSPAPGGPDASAGPVHVSERHRYSIVLPSDEWRVLERPGEWALGAFFVGDDPGVDYLEERGSDGEIVENVFVYLSSQPIPDTMSFDHWADLHDTSNQHHAECFQLQGDFEAGVVGGETARIGTYHCADFGDGNAWALVQTLVEHEGRGYAIYVFPGSQGAEMPAEPELRAAANDWLSRMSFTDSK